MNIGVYNIKPKDKFVYTMTSGARAIGSSAGTIVLLETHMR
jgi:hypothetical protein